MSYVDAIFRASQKANSRERKLSREAKRKLFEVDLIEQVDFDENEIFELAESRARYAEAH